jgi:hypothetical protein
VIQVRQKKKRRRTEKRVEKEEEKGGGEEREEEKDGEGDVKEEEKRSGKDTTRWGKMLSMAGILVALKPAVRGKDLAAYDGCTGEDGIVTVDKSGGKVQPLSSPIPSPSNTSLAHRAPLLLAEPA